jgi:hypothetical protein
MATSTMPAFTTAVVAALQGATSLSGVRIFDGIEIDMSYPGDAIAVGHDGNLDGDEVSASSIRQEYRPLGAISKFEHGSLSCFLWSANGTTDIATRRTQAFTLLGNVESVIRADVSFAGLVQFSAMETGEIRYRQTVNGAGVGILFTITYQSRI